MSKIFIKAYLNKNLGDDLFLEILSNRYQEKFYSVCNIKYKYHNLYKNIKFNRSYIYYYLIRIIEKITNKSIRLFSAIKKADIVINIGGSIFIEPNTNAKINKMYDMFHYANNLYIIGANFGPYKTETYKKYIEENVFKKAKDICFRDMYTYDLFKHLPNVRQAPDIVFTLDISKVKITNNKKVVISVINCEKKIGSKYKNLYEKRIVELIQFLKNKNYEIVLMSFCKEEGDEEAIESIVNRLNNIEVTKYYYNGNIKEALSILGDSQIIVGSRFHANILGLVMNKTIIPIAYSDKTINVLKDIKFKGKIFDIRNFKNIDTLTEQDLNYKLDIRKHKKEAQLHFKQLDKILIKRDKDNDE